MSKLMKATIKFTANGLGLALLLAFASRLFIIFSAVLGSYFLPIINPNAWDTGLPVLNLFARWDAGHYFKIADKGYNGENIGFFPLYPLLIKIVSLPLEYSMPKLWAMNTASFIISNTFFFLSIVGLYRLTYKIFQDGKMAYASTIFLSFHPVSVFFSAAYAESLTLALTIWSFIMLEDGKLLKSATLAFLAGLSRPIGFLASLPILLAGVKKRSIKEIALATFSASSIVAFDTYRYILTGNFYIPSMLYGLLRIPAQRPALIFNDLSTDVEINVALKILSTMAISVSIASCIMIGIMGKATKYVTYSATTFMVYFLYASMRGFIRYSTTIITIYWLLGFIGIKNKIVETMILCYTSMLLGLLTVIYANWYELP
jgi:hypothetical protein